ncbi:MAG TPA: murein L,D-transpeptidase [Ignavibacteria bacterium]|nr:murein L,D-transpeptidase [Ignavibacteria bacterium]
MPQNKHNNTNNNQEVYSNRFSSNIWGNVLLLSGGIILFFAGVILYGIIINIREVPLKEQMKLKGIKSINSPNIVIDRYNYSLSIYDDTLFVKSYRAVFGQNIKMAKTKKGDLATPVGVYKICAIDTLNKYHKFFRLNYPNLSDAMSGLRKGIINQQQFDQLKYEFYYDDCSHLKTNLGGNIGIHGIGELNFIFKNLPFVFNWTDGSIAISDEDIDELYTVIKKGTKVVIK